MSSPDRKHAGWVAEFGLNGPLMDVYRRAQQLRTYQFVQHECLEHCPGCEQYRDWLQSVLAELSAALRVRGGWAAERRETWRRLVRAGLSLSDAADATAAIHPSPDAY